MNAYQRVSAHRPDRMGTVVVGLLLPYDDRIGERVKDDDGVVWRVVASLIRSAEEGLESPTTKQEEDPK